MNRRTLWLGLVVSAVAVGCLGFLFTKAANRTVLPPTSAAPTAQISGKTFAQEVEAKRYQDAITSGNRRAIAALENALAAAREQSEPDLATIAKLQERLDFRRQRLESALH